MIYNTHVVLYVCKVLGFGLLMLIFWELRVGVGGEGGLEGASIRIFYTLKAMMQWIGWCMRAVHVLVVCVCTALVPYSVRLASRGVQLDFASSPRHDVGIVTLWERIE